MRALQFLDTPRLRIRRFRPDDVSPFVELMTDSNVTRFMSFPPELKASAAASELLDRTIREYDSESPMLAFAVEELPTRRFAGFCGLSVLATGGAELMYVIVDALQCQGYATEIARALSDHALHDLGVESVTAFVVARHVASRRVAERAGFHDRGATQHEGFAEGPVHAYVRGGA